MLRKTEEKPPQVELSLLLLGHFASIERLLIQKELFIMETDYSVWDLPNSDALRLAKMLDVDVDSICTRKTAATVEAPQCANCGRQIGLLDVANGALNKSKHEASFLAKFFCTTDVRTFVSEEDLARVSEVEHNVDCIDCGTRQKDKPKWPFFSWNWD